MVTRRQSPNGIDGRSSVNRVGSGPSSRQVPDLLPWKIRVKGGACAIGCDLPKARPNRDLARRQDARRNEDGPVALAGPVTGVVTAGTPGGGWGEWCGGSRPRRAPPSAKAAGYTAARSGE